MDIEFIKWLIGYAEGFDYKTLLVNTGVIKDYIYPPQSKNVAFLMSSKLPEFSLRANEIEKDLVYYPLLLQRAIEGVNRDHKYDIQSVYSEEKLWQTAIYECVELVDFFESDDIDQAKEQALKYIYEQEE